MKFFRHNLNNHGDWMNKRFFGYLRPSKHNGLFTKSYADGRQKGKQGNYERSKLK